MVMGLPRMTLKVRILGHRGTRKVRLSKSAKVMDLLEALDLIPQIVVTRRNGKIVVEEERLASGDLVEIIPIVTGG